jgi:fibronectin-binding autotransporter adhesin
VTTHEIDAFGLFSSISNTTSGADASINLEGRGSVNTSGDYADGMASLNKGFGAATVEMKSGTSVTTTGMLSNGVSSKSDKGAASFVQAAGAKVTVSGLESFGLHLSGATSASAEISGTVTAAGRFGVGASTQATAGNATIVVNANATVTGGWQTLATGLGGSSNQPSAGILIGASALGQLTNFGIIGAGSDRAIADIGRQVPAPGNLTVDNSGRITGFVEFAGGKTNIFNNAGLFDVRHFADTNGDGVRDTKRVSISDFGTAATSSFNNLAGAFVQLAPVIGQAVVDPASYYTPTTGAAPDRQLETSYYTLNRSGVVQGQFTNLGTFTNAGIVDLRGSATGNTLVMTGNNVAGGALGNGVFVSDGGQLLLNTFFNEGIPLAGQTGSFSDVLIVDSTTVNAGRATSITIDRREGPGAATPGNGILVVEVRDNLASDPGAFVLNGDFVADGQQQVVGGAHRYGLFHNGVVGDAADGNWYLRNLGLSPTVPIYEEYPKVLLPLIDVPTLQQRVGNRYWNEPAPRAPQTVFCKDASQNYQCAVSDEQASYYLNDDGSVIVETRGIWGRIEGMHGHYEPSTTTTGSRYDTNVWKLRAGLDGLLAERDSGRLIGGVTVQYGHSAASIAAPGSDGDISSNAYGIGGTLTWYGNNGFYADAQAQATWLDSDISSAIVGRTLVSGNDGFGYTLSLEAGQRITLDQHWTLTPQAQLTYSNLRFDSFTDVFGTTVSLLEGQSLRARLGLAAEYQSSWKDKDGTTSRISAYGIGNLYKEMLRGTRVNVSGYEFASRDNGVWGGLGLGETYNWDDDKYSVYGEVSANTGLKHFGKSYDVGGTLGVRVKW